MLAKGIASALFMLVCTSANAATFEYRIRSLTPNTVDSECHEKVALIGQKFAHSAGVEVTSTACYTNAYDNRTLDGVISYTADAQVAVTSFIEYGNYGIEDTAMYATKDDCLADLPHQTEVFESQTGLRSHLGYCYHNNHMLEPKWHLQIAATGSSEVEHYFMGANLFGKPSRGIEEFWNELSANITAQGYVISKAAFTNKTSHARLAIGYYGAERKYIHQNSDVRMVSAEACNTTIERTSAAFAELETPPVIIFCDHGNSGLWGVRMNIYTLEPNLNGPNSYRHRVLPGTYETIANCQAARSQQIDSLERGGVEVIDAVCGLDAYRNIIMHGFIRR